MILSRQKQLQLVSHTSSSSSWARSVADIGDHGLPILSVVSSPDKLIIGRLFSCYEVIQTACVFCELSSSAFGTTNLSTQYLLFSYIRRINFTVAFGSSNGMIALVTEGQGIDFSLCLVDVEPCDLHESHVFTKLMYRMRRLSCSFVIR